MFYLRKTLKIFKIEKKKKRAGVIVSYPFTSVSELVNTKRYEQKTDTRRKLKGAYDHT